MKEKILALLIAKFAGLRKDGLAQMASVLSLQVDKEEEATALVDKLTEDRINSFIKDWRKDVDKEVSDGIKTNEKTLKDKYDFVEKSSQQQQQQQQQKQNDDQTPAWAKALIDQNKAMSERLSAFENQKVTDSRMQQFEGKFGVLPTDSSLAVNFKAQRLKDFKRMSFESDEAFAEYLTEVETDITAFNQELANTNLSGQGKPIFGKKEANRS